MQNKGVVFMGMGFEMAGLVVGSIWLGSVVDQHFNLQGLGTAGLIIVSMVGWIYHLVILLNRIMKEDRSSGKSNDS